MGDAQNKQTFSSRPSHRKCCSPLAGSSIRFRKDVEYDVSALVEPPLCPCLTLWLWFIEVYGPTLANYLRTCSLAVYLQQPWFCVSYEVFSLIIYDSVLPSTYRRRLNLEKIAGGLKNQPLFVSSNLCLYSQGAEMKDRLHKLESILHCLMRFPVASCR